ncbi:E3 ubiquitin protein ligase DRIP2-like [Tripterygium wilfordii]|uniref:E3 ubiquitin protein ligase DRIP2-like n=1 Tax=Tripterygium wilfordii TaxID=458696 RepID=UPI0018F82271|nr:E3 ubiquitin protein ligase DRIP2-like [Tripterygium wilfordii]
MAGQVVKLKRETLEACMTCPLCNKLLREATMISVCLHTFCRKCIYEKLSDEEADCCPVCNIDIGCLPVEKLRPDHNLQDIRAKIFPLKRRKIKAPEITPSVAAPAKRKERSLSSLVVSAPKVSTQTGLTGRRTKAGARKAASLRGCGFIHELPIKKEEILEDHPMSSSSPESLNKTAQNKCQGSVVERSNDGEAKEDTGKDVETIEGKVDLWTPLNCLVEAANRTKSSKLNSPVSFSKSGTSNVPDYEFYSPESKAKKESPSVRDGEIFVPKSKNKDRGNNTKVEDIKGGTILLPGPVKRRRFRAASRKRAVMSDGQCTSAQAMVDASVSKCNRRNRPIWFSLVALEDQKGDESLPQIPTCYLRIRDGKMTVSFIQKYLAKKLYLPSEAEVEILCRGHPVLPTLQLHNLVDIWFRTAPTSKKVPASIGSSAKDFVMVLSYCRKVRAS